MMGSLTDVIEGKSIGKAQVFMASSGLFMMILTIGVGAFIGRRAIAGLEKEPSTVSARVPRSAEDVGSEEENDSVDLESGATPPQNTAAEFRFDDVPHDPSDTQRLLFNRSDSLSDIPDFETMSTMITRGLPSPFLSRFGIGRKHQSAPATIII